MFFKFFEFENSFILLFKHLVETKGLERLLSIDRYGEIKAKNEKLDNYILLLLKGLYENASKDIKKVYEANI